MSHRRKRKLIGDVDKEEFQRETARLLEQFLQSDIDEQRPVHIQWGNFVSTDNETDRSDIIRHQGFPDGVESKEAGDLTEDSDNIRQGVSGPRTKLEQELVHELRRMSDDIDRNEKLKANICQSMKDVTALVVYSSFTSTVQQYIGDLIGWGRVAFVFQFTKKAVQVAGRGGINARQIRENCLQYVEDKCADWIVRHGGWASMLPDDSDDSPPEVD